MSDYADQIINGNYGTKKKKNEIDYADQIINGNYGTSNSIDTTPASTNQIAPVNTEPKWYQKILQTPEAFKDGYQFGDVSKTILGTAGDVATGLAKGASDLGENIGKLAAGGVAQVADWTGNDEYAEKVRKNIAEKQSPVSKFIENTQDKLKINDHSVLGDTTDSALGAVGGILATMSVGGAGATIGGATKAVKGAEVGRDVAQTATMFSGSAGGALSDAYKKEDVTDTQAWTKALGQGAIDTLTEKIGGVFGKGSIDTKIANSISSKITSGAGKLLTRAGVSAGTEAAEELIGYMASQGLDKAIDTVSDGKGAKFKEDWDWDKVGEQMAVAALSSGMLNTGMYTSSISDIKKTQGLNTKDAVNELARQMDIQNGAVNEPVKVENSGLQAEGLKEAIASKQEELKSTKDIREASIIQAQIDNLNQELQDQTQKIQNEVQNQNVTNPENEVNIAPKSQENEKISQNSQENMQIAPIKQNEQVNIDTKSANQDIVENQRQEAFNNIKDEDAPTHGGLTTNEKDELSLYEDFLQDNKYEDLSKDSKKRYDYLKQTEEAEQNLKTNEYAPDNQYEKETKSPIEDRNIEDVGNRKVKAYQYENPEVRPYFQKAAETMLYDLNNSVKGERYPIFNRNPATGLNEITGYSGTTRLTTDDIAYLKDNYKYTNDQIEKGLKAIIHDEGAENNAVSKRIEFALNDRLKNGYKMYDGMPMPPDKEYLKYLQGKDFDAYSKEAFDAIKDEDAPQEINVPKEENIAPVKQNIPLNEQKGTLEHSKQESKQIIPTKENIAQNQNMSVSDNKAELDNIKHEVETNKNLTPTQLSIMQEQAKSLENRKESSFYENITEKSKAYSEEARQEIGKNEDVKYYKGITNEQTLKEANNELKKDRTSASIKFISMDSKNATAKDVAKGWILLKQYQDAKDYDSMIQVAKKMREMGTSAGQTIQAFNIMSRLTPEGMIKYAQSELSEAYDKISENKSKQWIDENKSKFDLTPEETAFIAKNMEDISKMDTPEYKQNRIKEILREYQKADNPQTMKTLKLEYDLLKKGDMDYAKRVKIAEIKKIMSDKIPPSLGQSIKSWMRISMLFNPKTQVRNVLGNFGIAPVNMVSDTISTAFDKAISSKTGVRTKGLTSFKSNVKGFKKGLYESYSDFKRDINTRDVDGAKFEDNIEGKSFTEKTVLGKTLNKIDTLNSAMLDAGDRGFYEAAFTNSLNNQRVLNGSNEVTADMIDIARTEALERTWQDNNNYTKFVLGARRGFNVIGIKDFGLGDVLIPFAKTPANLTKAIVEYSPLGLVKALKSGKNLKNSLSNGQFTPQKQHQFVQDLGKATAGTALYVLGAALAQAGITSGSGSDEDKDVKSFIKNTLGINNYSIEIGGHSFTYDWAQPMAAPLAITADIEQSKKDNKDLLESITKNLNTAGSVLLQQSFMDSINKVITNQDGIVSGLQEAVFDLPARSVPTVLKQITDMTDTTTRQQFIKDAPLESAMNSIKAKVPGLSETLAPSIDTLGNEIQKYGGENTAFNTFFNPSNVNSKKMDAAAKELYDVYKATGDVTLMPRTAPYSEKVGDETKPLSAEERSNLQKKSGQIVDDSVNQLIGTKAYKNMSSEEKAEVLKGISDYAYNKSKSEVLNTEISKTYQSVEKFKEIGGTVSEYYTYAKKLSDIKEGSTNSKKSLNFDEDSTEYKNASNEITTEKRNAMINTLTSSNLSDEKKAFMYGKYTNSDKANDIVKAGVPVDNYFDYVQQGFSADKDYNGKTISGSKKSKVISYINSMPLNIAQKAILIKSTNTFDFNKYNNQIVEYVDSLNISKSEKQKVLKGLDMTVNGNSISW